MAGLAFSRSKGRMGFVREKPLIICGMAGVAIDAGEIFDMLPLVSLDHLLFAAHMTSGAKAVWLHDEKGLMGRGMRVVAGQTLEILERGMGMRSGERFFYIRKVASETA